MFQELLEKIAMSLEKRGIQYMIIGGQAFVMRFEELWNTSK